jgi:hypothetical protein
MNNIRINIEKGSHKANQRENEWVGVAFDGLVAVGRQALDSKADGVVNIWIQTSLREQRIACEKSCGPHSVNISSISI